MAALCNNRAVSQRGHPHTLPVRLVKAFGFFALLLSLMGWEESAHAREDSSFTVTTWHSEEGLPHDNVTCITQTHDGYLWIGTPMGLARFDGTKFDSFSIANLPELGVNRITDIYECRDGELWIALENGRLLSWKEGVVHVLISEEGGPQRIVHLVQDAQDNVWFQTEDGELCRTGISGPHQIGSIETVTNARISCLATDSSGQLWVATKSGLRQWRANRLETPADLEEVTQKGINLVASGSDNSIWVVRGRQLHQIRAGKIISAVECPVEFGEVQAVLEAADHRLWISTTSGKLLCREGTGSFHVLGPKDGLGSVASILREDKEGDIWCASYRDGLSRIRRKLFQSHSLPETNGVPHYAFNVCSDPAGNIWARLETRTLISIAAGSNTPVVWDNLGVPDSIRAINCDRSGTLWLGSEGGGLYRMDGDKIKYVRKVGSNVNFISAIFEDSQTNLWVGFTGGAGAGRLRGEDVNHWEPIHDLPVKDVRAIAESSDGSIWFGMYYGGAAAYKDGHFVRYTTRDGLPSDYVRSLYADATGTVWIGTLRGLCRWKNGVLCAIKEENGLWNNAISQLLEDASGNFWIGSFKGVFRVAKQQLNDFADGRTTSVQCVGYNRNDGLPGLECPGGFQPAGARTPDGRIWFPTQGSLVSVDADHLAKNDPPPPVRIEQLSVEGKPRSILPTSHAEVIDPGKGHFEFRFVSLSLASPEKVRFRHKLEGLESEWSTPDNRRFVTYNYIPAGKYVFRVTACNNGGAWNPVEATLAIDVRPFFWQTSWFMVLAAAFVAGLLFYGVRYLERRKLMARLERIKRQRALERDRARIAKDIHDNAGAALAQVVFLSERIENCQPAGEIDALNKRINNAARQTIQSIDEIVWAVSPKHDTLESLANYLSSFAQEHLELAGVRCILDILPVLEPLTVSAEIRHNILLTAREALHNAVAYAKATEVHLSLDCRQELLKITIVDNGCGFDLEKLGGDGNGIPNMRSRMEEIGGKLEINSKLGEGTLVRISVLLNQLHVRGIAGANFED